MGFNMIKRTLPGTMKNRANTDCWRACKNVGKEAERQAERNAVGQGNVNLWGYLHMGQLSECLGMWMQKLPKKDISEHSFQGRCTESF